MGAVDTETKAYLSNKERFADAFNFSIYNGDYVIHPENLSPMDTAAIALPYGENDDLFKRRIMECAEKPSRYVGNRR